MDAARESPLPHAPSKREMESVGDWEEASGAPLMRVFNSCTDPKSQKQFADNWAEMAFSGAEYTPQEKQAAAALIARELGIAEKVLGGTAPPTGMPSSREMERPTDRSILGPAPAAPAAGGGRRGGAHITEEQARERRMTVHDALSESGETGDEESPSPNALYRARAVGLLLALPLLFWRQQGWAAPTELAHQTVEGILNLCVPGGLPQTCSGVWGPLQDTLLGRVFTGSPTCAELRVRYDAIIQRFWVAVGGGGTWVWNRMGSPAQICSHAVDLIVALMDRAAGAGGAGGPEDLVPYAWRQFIDPAGDGAGAATGGGRRRCRKGGRRTRRKGSRRKRFVKKRRRGTKRTRQRRKGRKTRGRRRRRRGGASRRVRRRR